MSKVKSEFVKKGGDNFTKEEKNILSTIKMFYEYDDKYIKIFRKIISSKYKNISIRLINHFVVNYANIHHTVYIIKVKGVEKKFYVNQEYNEQLKLYSKNYFDPFCRTNNGQIYYIYNCENGKTINILTTISQLNFFMWAIRHKILIHIQKHYDEIHNHLNQTKKEDDKIKKKLKSDSESISAKSTTKNDYKNICSSEHISSMTLSTEDTPARERKYQRISKNKSNNVKMYSANVVYFE
jgi:Zn-finger protein